MAARRLRALKPVLGLTLTEMRSPGNAALQEDLLLGAAATKTVMIMMVVAVVVAAAVAAAPAVRRPGPGIVASATMITMGATTTTAATRTVATEAPAARPLQELPHGTRRQLLPLELSLMEATLAATLVSPRWVLLQVLEPPRVPTWERRRHLQLTT